MSIETYILQEDVGCLAYLWLAYLTENGRVAARAALRKADMLYSDNEGLIAYVFQDGSSIFIRGNRYFVGNERRFTIYGQLDKEIKLPSRKRAGCKTITRLLERSGAFEVEEGMALFPDGVGVEIVFMGLRVLDSAEAEKLRKKFNK